MKLIHSCIYHTQNSQKHEIQMPQLLLTPDPNNPDPDHDDEERRIGRDDVGKKY